MMKAETKFGNKGKKPVGGGRTPTAGHAGHAPGGAAPKGASHKSAPPPGMRWRAGVHITPIFSVTETEGPRSNTDAATTNVDDPTFTGGAAVDVAAGMWRYQLKSVKGQGRIKFVYYTKDHYPAPTPNDDSGELSNVTKANWRVIVQDLESNKTGVAGNWSAYQRTIRHERYHWAKEWKGSVKKELVNAENDIAKEGVSFAAAADANAAKKVLAPKTTIIFDRAMAAARTAYNALGDSPGDPPYVAGSVGAVNLAARVKAHARTKKWG